MNGVQGDQSCIIADRNGIVENRHYVHAAVVEPSGRLLHVTGNPYRETLLRSAAKPAQALAILETGAFVKYGHNEADLALMCGSHNAEERHIKHARALLNKINATKDDLQCGGHPSISPSISHEWIKADFDPTPLYNNCSGKHAGMLAGAQALEAGMVRYHQLDHPMQQRVKSVVEELSGGSEDDIRWGVDGCNLPAPAMPLHRMARTYAKLAKAASIGARTSQPSKQEGNLACIFQAMVHYPGLVAGEGRFCTELMEAFNGILIGKVGADGCYGIAVRGSGEGVGSDSNGPIGIAVKIEDGSREVLYSAVAEILEQLQIGTSEMRQKLRSFHHPERLNTMGIVIGRLSHAFRLETIHTT